MTGRGNAFRATIPARWRHVTRWQIIAAAAVLVLLFVWIRQAAGPESLPDFSDSTDVDAKKEAFFGFLEPHIAAVNSGILEQRQLLLAIREKVADGDQAGWSARRWLDRTTETYRLAPPERYETAFLDQLLRRVDIVAPSLIMAQAANESAWGTSRFARQGNNLFGMRTHEPGTGIVPRRRPAGATWEVAAYDSAQESIAEFIHTLNTGDAYRTLRTIRRDLRRQNHPVTGSALAGGLVRYSEKGHEYVAIVRSMIRSNNLARYDRSPASAGTGS